MIEPMLTFLASLAALTISLSVPAIREAWVNYFREVRRLLIVNPLRAITGRHRPDYQLIAALERELGIRRRP